ncbi:hypothetical protein JX265_007259 [Neoarthrinium moseri]|uniref:Prolyl 4-hydroxylase alpha subunit domain-containing protein n=1 Tax=Neoarthrinium moseri TaxID=1658444 RepID=A0A9P9WK98_9PEZI|nr:uncharacterized protein JN550_012110 [Neoarthrinium moseri]KAI1859301.1 hypothetical protein JN550_012110 [Neoarthrinium moseri]KAI1867457.1 hypothetical protein JX265_007259 [Neoarthrinium moseri]
MKLTDILSGPTPPTASVKPVHFKDTGIDDKWAVVIEDLLTPTECEDLRSLVEPLDGEPWPAATLTAYSGLAVHQQETRRCGRIIFSSPVVAEALLARIMPFLPENITTLWNAMDITGAIPAVRKERWQISNLSEDLRFLKYEAGDYFKPHCDAVTSIGGKRSFLTVHLYLNHEGLEGGATSFMLDYKDPENNYVKVDPKAGSVLVFQQRDLYHEGSLVTKGTKYTVRTDVLYEKV